MNGNIQTRLMRLEYDLKCIMVKFQKRPSTAKARAKIQQLLWAAVPPDLTYPALAWKEIGYFVPEDLPLTTVLTFKFDEIHVTTSGIHIVMVLTGQTNEGQPVKFQTSMTPPVPETVANE